MTLRRATTALFVSLAAMVGTSAACGSQAKVIAKPVSVPDDIVPKTVAGDLTVNEFDPARKTFASAGATSLVADGRVWAIRKGDTLVGTLQVSTVKPDVEVTNTKDRKAILDGVMTGISYETIDVGDLKVVASTSADKNLYLWFGPKFFEVLQVKGGKADPDEIAADLIDYQQSVGKLGGGHQ